MDRAAIAQFKRDLIISTQKNIIRYLLDEGDFNFTKSHIYGDMIRKYPMYDEGKIVDIISNALFELFNNINIKSIVNKVIEEEVDDCTIDELLEVEEYRLWGGGYLMASSFMYKF